MKMTRISALFLLFCLVFLVACGGKRGVTVGKGSGGPSSENPPLSPSSGISEPEDLLESDPALHITELMVQNRLCAANDDGKYLPWVEIFNRSSGAVNLEEYTLSNGSLAYTLPQVQLKEGEFYLFFFEGLEAEGRLTLKHGDRVTEILNYLNRTPDCSFLTDNGSETSSPTPGYANVKEADNLVFSEIMPSNDVYPLDGQLGAFIEFFNAGEKQIDLGKLYLSDRSDDLYLCRLPDVTLEAGEYLALRCEGALHFALSAFGSTLYITRNDGVLAASATYPEAQKNSSYNCGTGKWETPSPGYPNTDEGRSSYVSSRKGLLLNELMPSNTRFYARNGEFYDLVELKNTGEESLQLSDYYISDSRKNLTKYRLPDVSLAPGQFYVLVCSGKGGAECSFKLSGDGEYLVLSRQGETILDAVDFPYVPTDRSYGRSNGQWVYFSSPSIGAENGTGFPQLSENPRASVQSGFYSAPFEVTFTGEGDIYYTLDGSRPTVASRKYEGEPIPVDGNITLRAFCVDGEKIASDVVTLNYFLDTPDLKLPVAKLSVPEEDMYGEEGIYTNYDEHLEVEGHIAFYVDGKEEFSENCGVRVHGNYSRQYKKKSYQLKFRAKYGCSSLKYDLFGDGSVTEFNSVLLRSGSQDQERAMMRDELASGTVLDYCPTVLAQNYRPMNLYINGEYVGIYYFREKIGPDFVASHWNVSPESVTIINSMEWLEWGSSSAQWTALSRFISQNDLTLEENYRYICENFCIESVIDYYIALCWADNRDGGNTRICKSDEYDGGRWYFIFYDSDLGFGTYYQSQNPSSADFLYGTYQPNTGCHNALIYKLLQNSTFRDLLLRRLDELCSTAFKTETVEKRIDELRDALDHDMLYVPQGHGIKRESWRSQALPQLISYTSGRAEKLKKEFSDLLNLSQDEIKKYFS